MIRSVRVDTKEAFVNRKMRGGFHLDHAYKSKSHVHAGYSHTYIRDTVTCTYEIYSYVLMGYTHKRL